MRTTSDKKDNMVRVRLNDEMMEYLTRTSTRTGKSISQCIRDMIQKSMFANR